MFALQNYLKLPVHIGGFSALNLSGKAHYIKADQELQIFNRYRSPIPSWFKNNNIWKLNKKIVYIKKNRKIIYSRLTLTKNYINKSKNIYLLINSIDKKKIFINYLSKKKNIPAHNLKINKIFIEQKLFFLNKNNI